MTRLFILLSIVSIIASNAFASFDPWYFNENIKSNNNFETSVPKISALSFVRFYQSYISPMLREDKCNFSPTCSHYSIDSINHFGAGKGLLMTFDRLQRCHRWAWLESYEREYITDTKTNQKYVKLSDPPDQND